jgi:hypothetical protein
LFRDEDASAEGMSESAHECCNRLQKERRVKQREEPSLRNDALQLFGDGDFFFPTILWMTTLFFLAKTSQIAPKIFVWQQEHVKKKGKK